MTRPPSIRSSMLLNLFVVIAFIVGAMWLTTTLMARRATRSLLNSLTDQTLDQTEDALARFFEPIEFGMAEARVWARDGLIGPDNPEAVRALFQPMLARFPQLSSLMVADEDGREVMLLRTSTPGGVSWRVRQVAQEGDRTLAHIAEFTSSVPTFDQPLLYQNGFHYDPRERPWFRNAIGLADPSATHWTAPYEFFTTREPGITASTTVTRTDGTRIVIGFDILLRDISNFTTDLRIRDSGVVLVLTMPENKRDARIVGLPYRAEYDDPERMDDDILLSASEIGSELLNDALGAIAKNPSALGGNPVRFRSHGEFWWTAHRQYLLSPDRPLVAGVLAPEAELLFGITNLRWWNVGVAAVMFVIAVFQIRRVAGKYSRPVEELVRRSDEIARGELNDAPAIPAGVFEISRLAEAQDRMRVALRSLLKVERDLMLARSIQQRTFPQQLPTLPGFDIAAWSTPADETGGDTYDVIGYVLDHEGKPALSDDEVEHAILLLADATGHGIGPALSVTQVRAMLRIAVRMGGRIETIAEQMNHQLCSDLIEGRFVTAWFGHIDVARETLQGLSAGQGPLAFLSRKHDTFSILDADAPPLGVLEDLVLESPDPIAFGAGDVFIAASDGIYEAMSPSGEQFGNARVEQCVRNPLGETAQGIIQSIRQALERFTQNAPALDDQTIIIVRKL